MKMRYVSNRVPVGQQDMSPSVLLEGFPDALDRTIGLLK